LLNRSPLHMKWTFERGHGSISDVGGVGSGGEYYFVPAKRPTLHAPAETLGREQIVPILPRNTLFSSLSPNVEDHQGIYELRHRQLINDVGVNGVFGHVYFSQEHSKLAVVGILARVKRIERLDDGGVYFTSEGIGRFYLRDIRSEKPYLTAKVKLFEDYCLDECLMKSLEKRLLDEVRYSIKLMKLLYPQNNYSLNAAVLKSRPPPAPKNGIRTVVLPTIESETVRRSKFSYAIMDMLKTDIVTKLLFLQEPVLDLRYTHMLKVCEIILFPISLFN
jgi:hypothetical protein